ncbi:MAG: PspC domain-containing protein [Bacteroidetes bacterium]|nr:PspC domain-containing protein [Bacteroidota bacterium]MCW5897179.1 PspC domain-containing protein [Bacteroidota bacterium]
MGFSFWHNWWWFGPDLLVPVLLILAGVAFLWGGRNSLTKPATAAPDQATGEPVPSYSEEQSQQPRRLYRSFTDSKLFGVCGGLGEYFGIDSTIVRILFLVAAFASGGIVLLGYILMAIILPKEIPSYKIS